MEENVFFGVTLLVSGEIVFDGDHGMWRTIAYAQCILCDNVGFRRSFWIIRYSCVFFLCAKSVFVLRKDGILYFIILRNNGFRWSPWHVDNHSVLLVLDGPLG